MSELVLFEYLAYICIIAVSVWMSYRSGTREGLLLGVDMCLDKLERDGAIRLIVDSDGEISDIVPGTRVQTK